MRRLFKKVFIGLLDSTLSLSPALFTGQYTIHSLFLLLCLLDSTLYTLSFYCFVYWTVHSTLSLSIALFTGQYTVLYSVHSLFLLLCFYLKESTAAVELYNITVSEQKSRRGRRQRRSFYKRKKN